MSDVAIDAVPNKAVTNVSITRSGDTFTVSWKTPHALTDSSNSRRIECFDVYWYYANTQCYYYRSGSAASIPPTGKRSSKFIGPLTRVDFHDWLSTSSTSDSLTVNLDPRQLARGSKAKNVLAEAQSNGVKSLNSNDKSDINSGNNPANQSSVTGIVAYVYPWNNRGYGPPAKAIFNLYAPQKPLMTVPTLNTSTGALSTTVSFSESSANNNYPVYSTTGYVTRIDNFNSAYKNEVTLSTYGSSTNSERTFTKDIADWQTIAYNQWIKLTFYANAYGIGRGTKWLSVDQKFTEYTDYFSKYASVSHVFSYPAQAAITKIDYSVSNLSSTGQLTIHLKTNSSTYHPVDSVKLLILKNSDASTSYDAGVSDGWEYVDGAEDNGNCVGFVDTMANAIPDTGKHVWYKLETKHDNLLRYSVAVEAKNLYRAAPTATDDEVVIDSIVPNSDGTSLTVTLGWNADDSTGTELSWAEKSTAWESTASPTTYNVTWKKTGSVVPNKNRYAKVSVEGLTEGTPYYFRARRYLSGDSGTSYGPYTSYRVNGKLKAVSPVSKPYSVIASVPEYTVKGKSLTVSWVYEANQKQKEWKVFFVRKTNGTTVSKLMASGTNAMTYTVISGEALSAYAGSDSAVYVRVSITTGGDWANSANAKTTFATAPSVKVQAPDGLSAMPYSFTVFTNRKNADVICKIKSCGATKTLPDGAVIQTSGETVWSESVSFEEFSNSTAWSIGQSLSVSSGAGFGFIDGSRYYLEVQAVNKVTGLKSSVKKIYFKVQWTHQATAPNKEKSYVKVNKVKNGTKATIFPGRPYGNSADTVQAAGDVCDIYRVTADGVDLVAEGLPFDKSVTDKYAPYNKNGNLRYILCTRTSEGDVNWLEVPYFMRNMNLRFDWDTDKFLEVPYNLDISDQYSKSFTGYSSLDGGYSGAWNATTGHKQKISTDVIKLDNAAQIEKVRALGKYTGPVFVRTPDGQAFAANVVVDDVQRTQDKPVVAVSFDCEEIDLAPEFRIRR